MNAAFNINKAVIVGLLGQDPHPICDSDGNVLYYKLSVAANETRRQSNGRQFQVTTWFNNVECHGWMIDKCQDLRKGNKVYLEATMENREWEKVLEDRVIRYKGVALICDKLELLNYKDSCRVCVEIIQSAGGHAPHGAPRSAVQPQRRSAIPPVAVNDEGDALPPAYDSDIPY